jgi:hypothetical protein
MATPFTDTPKLGVDLVGFVPAADLASGAQKSQAALGSQVFGADGRLYVYGRANATIAASTAVCTVNATTFLVTATGGAYRSPAFALATGDEAWFSKASV